MKYKFFIFISFLIIANSSYSQKVRLHGYVEDKNTGEMLIGATILSETSDAGTISNHFGYFTLLIEKNKGQFIKCSYIGYKTVNFTLKLSQDTLFNILLIPADYELGEVIIKSEKEKNIEERVEMGKVNIPVSVIKLLPSITGESDILKAYQLVPGIQSGTEGNNGLYVRGGTPDQNLFLLDDVPLYNVSHLGGVFSVFDPSMVKSIDMYKGGFPARYGGRISAVADIRNKDGNLYSYKGELGLSLFLSKIFIEGPISKGKSSFAFSVRRSNIDIYSFLYNRLVSNNYNQGYNFYDFNFKSNLKISENNRLFISLYNGKDKFHFNEKDLTVESAGIKYSSKSNLNWGNSAISLRWLHIFGNKIFNNTTFAFTRFVYNNENYFSRSELSDNSVLSDEMLILSSVNDIILKNDTEIALNNSKIRTGFVFSKHYYVPSLISYSQKYKHDNTDTTHISPNQIFNLSANDIFGYIEWEFKIGNKFSANSGIRTGGYFIDSSAFLSLEPRIVLNYLLWPSVSIKASYCKMNQNIHLLTNSNTGLPSDIWVPSTNHIKPETSDQFSVGLAHTTRNGYEITFETYFKYIGNLIEYKEGILVYNGSVQWEDKVESGGIGKIKGAEIMLTKKVGKLSGWLGYSLSSNKRNFPNLNYGRDFSFKYEQKNNISIVCNYKLSNKLTISSTWIYHSGNRITLPTGKYMLYNVNYYSSHVYDPIVYNDIHIYSEKNGYKMPDYHRLDVGLNYNVPKKKGSAIWSFGIYNLYNRQNAYYLFFKKTADGKSKLYQQSLYPLLVNFGYTYTF